MKGYLGDKLLNKTFDQLKTADNRWGLVDTDAQTKGYSNTKDATDTGIYAKENKKGETLSYAFTLPAGSYRIISAHREWWNGPRPMTASISYGADTTIDAGSFTPGKGSDVINTKDFTLDDEQLVTYTLTAANDQAPAISWLAVVDTAASAGEIHSYVYKDNEDGRTHSHYCFLCGKEKATENHTYKNDVCTACGAVHKHSYTYKDNGNGTHTGVCKEDNHSITQSHTFTNGVCVCGAKKPAGSGNDRPETIAVSKISFPAKSYQIAAGKKLELGKLVTVKPSNATNKALTWTTSKKNYATVNSKGTVSLKKAGAGKTVTITALAKDKSGKQATVKIKIMKQAVKKITLKAKSKTLKAGKKLTVKATVSPKGSSSKLDWTSSNKKYATVNSKGVVTAKKAGKGKKVKITATATDSSKKKATI